MFSFLLTYSNLPHSVYAENNNTPRNGTAVSSGRMVPDLKMLDKRYQDRRRRNNEAVRRCRENKRARLIGRAEVTDRLQTENRVLRTELTGLSMELKALRKLLGTQSARASETSVDDSMASSSAADSPTHQKIEDGVTTSEPDGIDRPMSNGLTVSPSQSTLGEMKLESFTNHDGHSPSGGDAWSEDATVTPSVYVKKFHSVPDNSNDSGPNSPELPVVVCTESDQNASDEFGSQISNVPSTIAHSVLPHSTNSSNQPRMRKRLSRTVIRRYSPKEDQSPTDRKPDSDCMMDCEKIGERSDTSMDCTNTNQEDLITS
ncbi:Nuclear factor interleukin-3-regulated protein isoform 2 [Fasciolopsis buskii]|uniref:Nuclear factor interleukin-3-regulated protein isoform 2 n=1 Tax=Fasciolopsis buskii TaxID=27845 RepID=A0A8E0VFQ9_9TREM|nr:Nuclear factor interleukin-3-regulated protein isoform 2 [Fasciolopsis buski]